MRIDPRASWTLINLAGSNPAALTHQLKQHNDTNMTKYEAFCDALKHPEEWWMVMCACKYGDGIVFAYQHRSQVFGVGVESKRGIMRPFETICWFVDGNHIQIIGPQEHELHALFQEMRFQVADVRFENTVLDEPMPEGVPND